MFAYEQSQWALPFDGVYTNRPAAYGVVHQRYRACPELARPRAAWLRARGIYVPEGAPDPAKGGLPVIVALASMPTVPPPPPCRPRAPAWLPATQGRPRQKRAVRSRPGWRAP